MRLFLGSFLGGLSSVVIFLPNTNVFIHVLIKTVVGTIIVLAAFSYKNYIYFLKRLIYFLCSSFCFCGIILILNSVFGSAVYMSNLVIYFNMSPVALILCTAICYFIIKAVCAVFGRTTDEKSIYQLQIFYDNQVLSCDALLDTGNNLRDIYSGEPVIVLEQSLAQKLLKIPVTTFDNNLRGFRLIPYSVVSGGGVLPAFKPDDIVVKSDKKSEHVKAVVAVSNTPVHNQYKALLSREITEVLEE